MVFGFRSFAFVALARAKYWHQMQEWAFAMKRVDVDLHLTAIHIHSEPALLDGQTSATL
jgi:hypothetical protein